MNEANLMTYSTQKIGVRGIFLKSGFDLLQKRQQNFLLGFDEGAQQK
jgi:hypothetical protein